MYNDHILKSVKDFLDLHHVDGRPLLVGFSGGSDSLALLHLLLECSCNLHVAHVDHGWREESSGEVEKLRAHVEGLNLPFYLRRLENIPMKEDAAREARLSFFQELYDKLGCQAVVLGHQGDDQSETVLKRVLEGASLIALKGILAITSMNGMQLWRPLLGVDKTSLRAWLEKRRLEPIEDRTNLDPRYLRARMRTAILPELERHFGKEVSENLRRLGDAAKELGDYLARQVQKYEEQVVEDREEKRVNLSGFYPFEPLEIKIFLKKFSEKNDVFLSHAALQSLYEILEKGELYRKVGSKGRWIEVRGRSIAIKKI
jgi:tRNA(Ile)-lysidine synthase